MHHRGAELSFCPCDLKGGRCGAEASAGGGIHLDGSRIQKTGVGGVPADGGLLSILPEKACGGRGYPCAQCFENSQTPGERMLGGADCRSAGDHEKYDKISQQRDL